tara:strand:- start:12066 stop:12593 length:528 start_codon:yes stop_codon:yes gene_type:complete
MAISVINSQGMKMFILDTAQAAAITGTPATDIPLIIEGTGTNSSLTGCPQSVGAIEETRAVTEYKCMSTNDTAKALGAIERGNIEIGLLFDPTDTLGQAELKAAFAANVIVGVGIELPDRDISIGSTGVSGTIFYFEGAISGVSTGIVQDEAVTYTVTVEIASIVTEYEAVAGTV